MPKLSFALSGVDVELKIPTYLDALRVCAMTVLPSRPTKRYIVRSRCSASSSLRGEDLPAKGGNAGPPAAPEEGALLPVFAGVSLVGAVPLVELAC